MTSITPEHPRRCSSDAGRVFSSGVRVDKVPYGLGVFAFAFIPKGTPIGRVSGKMIRDPDYGSDYCISAGEGSVLEPGPPFCYLNHCCEPNCQLMQYVREDDAEDENLETGELSTDEMDYQDEVDEMDYDAEAELSDEGEDCFFGDGAAAEYGDEEACEAENVADSEDDEDGDEDDMMFEDDVDAEIWVESCRDIMPGEELTIDYAWPADRSVQCLCDSPNCRGWIVDPAELDELQEYLAESRSESQPHAMDEESEA